MVADGCSRLEVQQHFGVHQRTLATWINKRERSEGFWQPGTRELTKIDPRLSKVGDIRKACDLMDIPGITLSEVEGRTGNSRQTLRRWRDDPRFREATYEYDPQFAYDSTDLLDRATVAAHLCNEATVGERYNLLAAVIGDVDEIEPPVKHGFGRAIGLESS